MVYHTIQNQRWGGIEIWISRLEIKLGDNQAGWVSTENLITTVSLKSYLIFDVQVKDNQGHQLPFNPSAQTAKNTGLKVTCVDCFKPRLLHSQRKLKPDDVWWLDSLLEDMSYSRGSSIQEMDGDRWDILDRVFARANLVCNTPIELPYYTVGHVVICQHCGNDESLTVKDGCYHICAECTRKKKTPKARRCGKSVNTQ